MKNDNRKTTQKGTARKGSATTDDERTAYLTGRVLRHADDETFAAFVELAARIGAEPARAEEVLQMCQITEAVRERQRGKRDLAELISAVLNHDDVPADLHNAIGDAIGGLPGYGPAHKDPGMIRAVLSYQPQGDEQDA